MASLSLHAALLLFLLCTQPLISTARCLQQERNALLGFKANIRDPTKKLASWVGDDCCQWRGVHCSNTTGHVIQLDLHNPQPLNYDGSPDYSGSLGGEINPSLLGLEHLSYLDLSLNYFVGASIPKFISSLKELTYINFSRAGFTGIIPPELGNLSSLRHLDLYSLTPALYADDVQWISSLSSLRYLNMGGVNLISVTNWLLVLNMLPSITEIHLSSCQLRNLPQTLPRTNFTTLSVLDLSDNTFNSSRIPDYLFHIRSLKHLDLRASEFRGAVSAAIGNLTSLEYLDLSYNVYFVGRMPRSLGRLCNLHTLYLSASLSSDNLAEFGEVLNGCIRNGLEELALEANGFLEPLPDWLGNLKNLKTLDLSSNNLYGPIPASIGRMSSLENLQLTKNGFNGTVSESIGQLSKLEYLDLSFNPLKTVMSEAHFTNLTSLNYLELTESSLALHVSSDWIPPFQLEVIHLSSCRLGPRFPAWIRTQVNAFILGMTNTGLSGTMPDWFWEVLSYLNVAELSLNKISGKMPRILKVGKYGPVTLDLSSNHLEGPIPIFSSNLIGLDLSNNSLSGTIPPAMGNALPYLTFLSLSANNLHGGIAYSLCNMRSLRFLVLSSNQLSGEIPDCWENLVRMQFLSLANNNLSGVIPGSIGSLPLLNVLDLTNNSLGGELPVLKGCKELVLLNLEQNKLTGSLPTWIGESLSRLLILSLRSNMFTGDIPLQLSQLSFLHFLDLSNNRLSGIIPASFKNFTAMKVVRRRAGESYVNFWRTPMVVMQVVMKGRDLDYGKLLSLLTSMDLSDNNLSGQIPEELMDLAGLRNLNLSGNSLAGEIPERIGELRSLESLDLSRNELSGPIPSGLSSLNFLSNLNVSYNNLSGRVPSGGQLQTFNDPSVFAGNHDLSGFPLTVNCPVDDKGQGPKSFADDEGENGILWFSLGAGTGFAAGFWTVFGVLVLNRLWRITYFRFVDGLYDTIYVAFARNMTKLKRSLFGGRM
ncbi:receptor-like protein EIX2 [Phoenix dactylifera]|uniref:Receptor-like protein EIX2 n=1 Tax=Phoenix dactylifera TaxID=42345 RepID=A0A8B7BFC7_PHODC|nr:receptor-like protein EIX2 [Phoenix dactylifera]